MLFYFQEDELQSELDNIQTLVNGVVLSPDEEMELDPGETTISVVFMGGVTPDLLSDIIIEVDGSDSITTLQCDNTRNCTQTVCRSSQKLTASHKNVPAQMFSNSSSKNPTTQIFTQPKQCHIAKTFASHYYASKVH